MTEAGLCLDGGDALRMSLSAQEMQQVMALVDAAIAEFATPAQIQGWRDACSVVPAADQGVRGDGGGVADRRL